MVKKIIEKWLKCGHSAKKVKWLGYGEVQLGVCLICYEKKM